VSLLKFATQLPGRHTLRYRSIGPDGKGDTTWTFTVAST